MGRSKKTAVPEVMDDVNDPKLLASSIVKVAEAADRLLNRSGLTRDAIVVLLKDMTGVSKENIKAVLDGAADLAKYYTRRV